MSDTRWVISNFFLLLLAVWILCLVGCSKSVRTVPDTDWIQSDSLNDFKIQVNRPPSAKVLWAMADILAKQGKDSECEFVLKRIIQEHPDFMPAYNSLAELKMRQGHAKAAIKTLQQGLSIEPKAPVLLNNLGMCWIILQDYEIALDAFTEAAGIMPENRKYRANMAVALGLLGRDEEALSLFKQVLPENFAYQNMVVLQKKKSEDSAVPNTLASSDDEKAVGSKITDDASADPNTPAPSEEVDSLGTPLP